MKKFVDPFKRGKYLRKKLVDKYGRVLCVDFAGTLQQKDIHKDLIMDSESGRYTFRAKINIKDFDSEMRLEKGLSPFDFSDEKAIMAVINDSANFDIPLWFLRKANDELKNIVLYDLPLIYQLMGCNFCVKNVTSGCIQCFVDNKSNVPDTVSGVWLSAKNVVDAFESEKQNRDLRVIRTSGGEPTLVLDHILSLYEELKKRCHWSILHQFDTNLSTGRLIDHFVETGVYPKDILKMIAEYNPGVLVSFKGTTDEDLQANTQSTLTISEQLYTLKKFVSAGIDVYPLVYTPDAKHLKKFLKRLADNFEFILWKTHIVMTKTYSPTKERIFALAKERGKEPEKLFEEQLLKWKTDYEQSCEIIDNILYERYKLHYKELERPGIKLTVKKSSR